MLLLVLAASGSALGTAATGLQWEDASVQQCLDLCSNVDLVYKLLIQEIQPVSSKLHLLLPLCIFLLSASKHSVILLKDLDLHHCPACLEPRSGANVRMHAVERG